MILNILPLETKVFEQRNFTIFFIEINKNNEKYKTSFHRISIRYEECF